VLQEIIPSIATLSFRSTRDQNGNFITIIATVRAYQSLQLDVFLFCPFTRPVNAVLQGNITRTSSRPVNAVLSRKHATCDDIDF
jgi:hypothetical protein